MTPVGKSPHDPIFKLLWIGRGGFGLVWRGVEHQFYRDMDGSMGKPWTHYNLGKWRSL